MDTSRNPSKREITMIDAATLDEDQFSHLVASLDTRNWFIPIMIALTLTIAAVIQIT